MFCDLVGSTAISEQLDPEVFREVLLQFQDLCAAAVRRFDGHVARFLGDGILVYFGYPRAHEDDARRAAAAGLAIVESVRGTAFDTGDGGSMELEIRVGIHTGVAVIAEMGAGDRRETDDIVGETPNIASRVQAAARPNSVIVSSSTHDLIRGWFDVTALGPRPLRGVAQALDLFEVLRSSGAETRLEAVPDRTAMVDRERESATLLGAWADAVGGRPSSFTIEGDAGIGKSRLVELVRDEAVRQGGAQLTITCSPLHTNTVLNPVVRLLVRVTGLDRDDARSPWTRLVEKLSSHGPVPTDDLALLAALLSVEVPASVPVAELTPEHRREQTFQAFLRLVDRMADDAPLLLVAEDVHWADPSTIELLRRLAGRVGRRRTMLLLTARPGGPDVGGPSVPTLRLQPLDDAHRDEMVRGLLPDDLPDSFRRLIVERSDGVPLFIEELSRTLGDAADERRQPSLLGAAMDVPPSLHDLLAARLDSRPREKVLAQAVATIGQPAPCRLVEQILGLDAEFVGKGLDALVGAGILMAGQQAGVSVYSFGHALLRDAAYNSQLRAHRRVLHARVAQVFEADWPEVARTQPELLAHHFGCAGLGLRSAGHWYAAGMVAAGLAAHTEAVGHFRNALAVLDGSTDAQGGLALRHSVQGALACSLLALLGYTSPEVEEEYRRALALAAEAEAEGPALATTWGLWAYYTVRGEHAVAVELAERCNDSAEAGSNPSEVLEAAAMLGYQRFYLGQFADARALLRAGATYRAGVDVSGYPSDPGVASLANLGPTLLILGHPRKAEEAMAHALARAEELHSSTRLFTRAYTCAFAAWYYQLAGMPKRAAEHATRAIEISAEHGFATWLGAGALHLSIAEATIGDPERSIPSIEWGLQAWVEAGAELFRPYFLFWLADARRRAADPAGALRAVDEALAAMVAHDERFFEAELLRLRGELTEDPKVLWDAVHVARGQQARTFELRAASSLHRLCPSGEGTEAALRAVVTWFPDRLDTPDLRLARATLGDAGAAA